MKKEENEKFHWLSIKEKLIFKSENASFICLFEHDDDLWTDTLEPRKGKKRVKGSTSSESL